MFGATKKEALGATGRGESPYMLGVTRLYRYLANERSETMATDFKAAS
jgi:hypothetical protein